MGIIKVSIEDEVEKRFRETAMRKFGYSRGSLSSAAQKAFMYWVDKEKDILDIRSQVKRDPVESMRGILKHVKKSSIELQHEVGKIWAEEARK